MSEQTFSRRLYKLVTEVYNHPYKKELLNIMQQQLVDDTVIVDTE